MRDFSGETRSGVIALLVAQKELPMLETLVEAQQMVLNNRDEGVECPCCQQYAKVYRRPLTAEMGMFLVSLFKAKAEADGFIDIKSISVRGGDYAKTRYYGFVEHKEKDPSDISKRTSGRWRLTEKGLEFVMGMSRVPTHMFIYDQKFLGFDEKKTTDIKEVLGKDFNYDELMNG